MIRLTDSVELTGTRRTRDGYLAAQVRAGRTGIQLYGGAELGRPELASVRVFRSAEAVFDRAALATFAHRPVTVEHPSDAVTAANWKDHAVGMTGSDVIRDGDFVSVPMVLMDAEAITAVEQGKRELSWGYDCQIEWNPGTTPDGEAFDARMTSLRGNHLAVVDHARAGPDCRIGDAPRPRAADPATPSPTNLPKGERPMADETTRAVVLDGLTIRTNDAGAEAIARLQRQINDATAAHAAVAADHQRIVDGLNGQVAALGATHRTALEAKDGELAGLRAAHATAIQAKDGEIEALRAATDPAALDARVAQRAALVQQARRILGDAYDPTGRTDADVRRDAVTRAMGTALTDAANRSDAYFDAAFETVVALAPAAAVAPRVADARPDPLRDALMRVPAQVGDGGQPQPVSAWERNRQRLADGWKHTNQKEAV